MTKTFITNETHQFLKDGRPGIMPLVIMADGSFVWVFEFGSLGFVCDLVFGA